MDADTKERPIIFSAPMVRALIDGRKTQTRRINKFMSAMWPHQSEGKSIDVAKMDRHTPFGTVGDRLYVRENITFDDDKGWCYAADMKTLAWRKEDEHAGIAWLDTRPARRYSYPSIHMPRWASRITLTITDVRVERVQDISRADVAAEGVAEDFIEHAGMSRHDCQERARQAFGRLWASIHGPGAWYENPWVFALTFTTEVRK